MFSRKKAQIREIKIYPINVVTIWCMYKNIKNRRWIYNKTYSLTIGLT